MKTVVKVLLAVAVLITFLLLSCKKESSMNVNKQKVSIYLTDNPVNFQAVNINILKVEVKVEVDSAGIEHEFWDSLIIRPGIYNILNFRNGVDTLFAQGFITKGEIKKIRITIGNGNTVEVDGITYPLTLKKPQVIIDVDDISVMNPNDIKLNLDFDASGSIIQINSNQFELEPKIRTFSDDHDGRIEGTVSPKEAGAIVSVTFGGQTLLAIPEQDGKFKIRGIKASAVDLFVNATANGYRDTTITNITVGSHEIKLPAIVLRK